ncbi:MAG: ATP-binding protein [Deltaproteobacteria bacterium]|nr:ATP-binding protein [Deltaproteobacteria bacterium]
MPSNANNKHCKKCQGLNIVIIPRGKHAFAELCPDCQKACRLCEDTGYILKRDDLGRESAEPCECAVIKRKVELYNAADIPSQFYDATFENFHTSNNPSLKEALNTARLSFKKFNTGDKKGFVFFGGVGVGKTRLVCTMIRVFVLEHVVPCLFKEFSSLLSEIKTGYDKGLSENQLIEKVNQTEILVIDELGKGRKSEWEISILDSIIANRYNMKKTTIFTTNYTDDPNTTFTPTSDSGEGDDPHFDPLKKETLEQRVYPRIYSRLKEMCVFIKMSGADRRLPKNHQNYS